MGRLRLAAIAFLLSAPPAADAQQVHVGPTQNVGGGGFYENIGLQWGAHGNGWFYNSPGLAPIPFGGGSGGGGGSFGGLTFDQGASTALGSSSPSVTVMNGATGYFSDTVQRPFVTGLVPVVGNLAAPPPIPHMNAAPVHPVLQKLEQLEQGATISPRDPTAELRAHSDAASQTPASRRTSSAEQGALSVAELKAQRQVAANNDDRELADYIARAAALEAEGKPRVARVYYQMAARRASGEQQQQLLDKVQSLSR